MAMLSDDEINSLLNVTDGNLEGGVVCEPKPLSSIKAEEEAKKKKFLLQMQKELEFMSELEVTR